MVTPDPSRHHPVVAAKQAQRTADLQLRIADWITGFAGSMWFVYIHVALFSIWMLFIEAKPWPMLTLIVSLEAIFLSTFVMIGQNRQSDFQQAKADHDFTEEDLELKTNTELTREIHTLTTELHNRLLDEPARQALLHGVAFAPDCGTDNQCGLFGTCDPSAGGDLAGLPALALEGLADADARALLASVIPGRLDERVRDRIIAESGGNPLALLELPRGLSPAELAGGFGVAGSAPLAGRIEQSFRRRIAPLPEATRRLLLLAAASRWAIRRCCGGRPQALASALTPLIRPKRTGCSPSLPGSPSATPSSARPSIRRRRPQTAAWPTVPSPRSPTRAPIPIAGPGTRPRRHRGPMRTSPPSWSGPPAARRRAAGSRRSRPSSNDLPR